MRGTRFGLVAECAGLTQLEGTLWLIHGMGLEGQDESDRLTLWDCLSSIPTSEGEYVGGV